MNENKKTNLKKRIKENLPLFFIWLGITSVFVILDQITKYFAASRLPDNPKPDFIPFIFNLVYVENKGSAWGMFADSRWVFMIVSSVAIIAVTVALLLLAKEHKMFCISLTLILAGGIGNMIDRVMNGFVVDFLQFSFWEAFPVFNGADSFVTVGAALMLIYVLFFDKKLFRDEKKPKASADAKIEGETDAGEDNSNN